MHSTCCIQILTRSGNQAHVTELLRRNEEDHTNPLKHLLEPVLLSWCYSGADVGCPPPPETSAQADLQLSTRVCSRAHGGE